PVAVIGGSGVAFLINPESAAGSPDYVRNFRWLTNLQHALFLCALGAGALLWIAACAFVLRSKKQPWGWLLLAGFGPFGFIALTILRDREPAARDYYAAFVAKLKWPLRLLYEAGFFLLVWTGAFQAMLIKRELQI